MFEIVHTLTDWYDGPRRGIADLQGVAHYFESDWSDLEGAEQDIFLLTPIDAATLALALEDWQIWRRWETAFYEERTTIETHPALPDDRDRHEALQPLLEQRLRINPAHVIRKLAEFQPRSDPNWNGLGRGPLQVRWRDVTVAEQ